MHPWEIAGHGKAPFRCIGVERRVGPIDLGNGMSCGAPGQPMGTCDVCGQGIADCYLIRSADRKQFIVGCDCVRKTLEEYEDRTLDREVRRYRLDLEHAKTDARIAAARERLPSVWGTLAAQPHPYDVQRERGLTMADFCTWMLAHAGRAGKVKAARIIEGA